MKGSHWAIFFVFLLSSEYVVASVGTLVRHKRQRRCIPKPQMITVFEKCFENVRVQIDESISVQDNAFENVQLTEGTVSGIQNFRISRPITCVCFRDFIRIFIQLSFLDITVTFLVTLLDGLLGGLVGNLGRSLARLLGNVVNLVVNLVCLEINIVIAVDQRFLPRSTCIVSSYRVTRISGIKVLNIDLTDLVVGLLGDILTPVVETLVKNLMDGQVRIIITREIQKLRITDDMHNCRG